MTPSQIESVERHKAFHRKIAAQAKPDTGISCRSIPGFIPARERPRSPPPPTAAQIDEWAERQKAILVVPQQPWFSIVAEIGPIPPITIKQIIRTVAEVHGVTPNDIISSRRLASIALSRQIAMYLAKEMTGFSLPALGRQFGYRDHTTVLHGVRKIATRWRVDGEFMAHIERLKDQIRTDHNARYLHHAEAPSPSPEAAADQSPPHLEGQREAAVDPAG